MSKQANEVSFTPEYSTELLRCIEEVYEEDIKHYYTHLKLEKLIDLLEHTEYLFESHVKFLGEGKDQEALTVFVVGCFYLYLIVPQSIQFQTRNKSYSIYNELKKLYEHQVNMTNVLLMVKDEVDSILDGNARDSTEIERKITRKRAYSVPDQNLAADLAALALNNDAPPLPHTKNAIGEETSGGKSWDSSFNDDGEDFPIWTAPPLEPNDQLKLALDSNMTYPSEFNNDNLPSNEYSEAASLVSINHHANPSRGRQGSVPIKQTVYPIYEDTSINPDSQDHAPPAEYDIWEANVDRLNTHRKDSYHSVYMFDEGPEAENGLQHSTNGYIDNLQRLQKQSIITAPELFSILSSPEEQPRLLLIDLRISKRYKVNHIVAPNILHVDPRSLWNPQTKVPVSNTAVLDNLITDPLFAQRSSFDYIVYYTDMKTYMNIEYDYLFTLFYLLVTSQTVALKTLPTYLLGGWEKWKKTLNKYASEYNINVNDYMFRPYGESTNSSRETSHKAFLPPPSWKPPEVPMRIRKRPPPPPPMNAPTPPGIPPPVPPKIGIHQDVRRHHHAPKVINSSPIDVPKSSHHKHHTKSAYLQEIPRERFTKLERSFSIPTIEKSSNTYVSLSITGLRNLGNTCYINSMLQCLFSTSLFRDLFLSSKYEQFFNARFINQPRLSKSFGELFKKMYINGGCSVVPTGFLKSVNYLRPDMRIPDDQQDTQEFLMVVLDRLHDELSNQVEVAQEYPDLLLYDEDKLQVKNDEYRNWFEKTVIGNGLSPIDHIFQGQMENILECQRCGNTSQSYSTFYILSLAIPKPASSAFSRSKRVKLEDCINLFTSDELLSGENAWDCPKCGSSISGSGPVESKRAKKKYIEFPSSSRSKNKFFSLNSKSSRSKSPFGRFASKNSNENWKSKKLLTVKTMNFITMPPVLVIHLSRFYYDLTKKNNTIITYPLILNIIPKNNQIVKYRLYAVVNHSGNLISGHYTSLVNKDLRHNLHKEGQKWYYFDDEVVKEERNHGNLDEGIIKVSSSDVYVIFYERIDT